MKREKHGPYLEACGKCNVPMKVHPVPQCPYNYTPIMHPRQRGKIVGYELTRKRR